MRNKPKRDLVIGGGIVGVTLAVAIATGAAFVATSPSAFACTVDHSMRAAFGQQDVQPNADVYIVNFAANSAELNPVAERVLMSAAASYPAQPVIGVQIRGGEQVGAAPITIDLDRHAVVTAYLVRHDVPLSAIAFDKGQLAQSGCNVRGA